MGKEFDLNAAEEKYGNLCKEFCKAACCRNTILLDMTPEEFDIFIQRAKQVEPAIFQERLLDFALGNDYQKEGIFYLENEKGNLDVGINGKCHNLLPDNSCDIYNDRPTPCRGLEVGSDTCGESRKDIGLRPLEKVISMDEIPVSNSFSLKRLIGR